MDNRQIPIYRILSFPLIAPFPSDNLHSASQESSPTSPAGHKMAVTGKRGAALEIEASRTAPCVLFFGGFRTVRRGRAAVWRCTGRTGVPLRIWGPVLFSGICRIAGKAAGDPCRRRIRRVPGPGLRFVRLLRGAWPGTESKRRS